LKAEYNQKQQELFSAVTEHVLSPASAAVSVGSLGSFANSSRRELSTELSFSGLDLKSQTVPLQSVK